MPMLAVLAVAATSARPQPCRPTSSLPSGRHHGESHARLLLRVLRVAFITPSRCHGPCAAPDSSCSSYTYLYTSPVLYQYRYRLPTDDRRPTRCRCIRVINTAGMTPRTWLPLRPCPSTMLRYSSSGPVRSAMLICPVSLAGLLHVTCALQPAARRASCPWWLSGDVG
jgi:hypothetical protein